MNRRKMGVGRSIDEIAGSTDDRLIKSEGRLTKGGGGDSFLIRDQDPCHLLALILTLTSSGNRIPINSVASSLVLSSKSDTCAVRVRVSFDSLGAVLGFVLKSRIGSS